MSGHSKWSTIKHKKAASDAKRGKEFTRIAKELTIAAREGGGDVNSNTAPRLAVAKARASNMPKDNIDRAIKRGTGELEGGELIEAVYEAYGPHGVGILVHVVTDNRNRAVADVRHAVNKYGGSMAEAGAVSWQFTRKGYISVTDSVGPDELFMVAADAGAEDVHFGDGMAEIFVDVEAFHGVRLALEEAGIAAADASLVYEPNAPVSLGQTEALQVMNLVEKIEDLDDVQNVYSALEITDEAIAAMEAA
jgi:YebC/PmpR family DNA-binding regulatory protein